MPQKNLIDTALGLIPPDLYLQGGSIINVYTGEKYKADIAIKDGYIAYVGNELGGTLLDEYTIIDVSGFNLLPGYIEPHGHPLQIHNIIEYTRAASRNGLTAIVADSYKVLKALGVNKFLAYTKEINKRTPVRVYWFIRIFAMENLSPGEALYSSAELQELIKHPWILGIGETTRWPAILQKSSFPLQAINMLRSAGKRPDGHTSGANGKKLAALAAAGISGCHESMTAENVLERLRNGMHVMLRHSSQRPDIDNFLGILEDEKVDRSRFMLTTDGTSPAFIDQNWTIASIAEQLISKGIEPLTAIRMITLNPASYFRIDHEIGSITPGRAADIVITEGINLGRPRMVLIGGQIVHGGDITHEGNKEIKIFYGKGKNAVVETNKKLFKASPLIGLPKTYFAYDWQITPEMFTVSVPDSKKDAGKEIQFPVIEMVNAIITRRLDLTLPVADGIVTPGNTPPGLLKIALLDMQKRRISTGFIKGLASGLEGFASSTCCNLGVIIVIGSNDATMALVANHILKRGGGMALAENNAIIWEIKLELPGELADLPFEEVSRLARELETYAREKGYTQGDFFHTIHFLPCDFLPYIRINREGIFDVVNNKIIYHHN